MDATYFSGPSLITEYDAITPASGNPNAGVAGGFRFYNSAGVAYAAVGTSSVPVLYNPVGSGYLARIQAVRIGVTGGTVIQGALGYGVATGAALSTVTAGPNPLSAYLGGHGIACPFLWYTTATSAAAPIFVPMGVNTGGAYAAGAFFSIQDMIGGFIVLAPGAAFYPIVASGAMAATALCVVDVIATPLLTGN